MSRSIVTAPSPLSSSRSSTRTTSPSTPLSPQSPNQNRGVRSLVQRYESASTVKEPQSGTSSPPPPMEATQASPDHSLRPTSLQSSPSATGRYSKYLTNAQDISKDLASIQASVARTSSYLYDGKPLERPERPDRSQVLSNYTKPSTSNSNSNLALSAAESDLAILRQRYYRLFGNNNQPSPSPPGSPRLQSPTPKSPDTSFTSPSTPTTTTATVSLSPLTLSPPTSTTTTTTLSSSSPSLGLSPSAKLLLSQSQAPLTHPNSQSLTPPPSPRHSFTLSQNLSSSNLSLNGSTNLNFNSPSVSSSSTTTSTSTPTPSTFVCLICKVTKPLYLCQVNSVCNHSFCQSCIKEYLTHQIKTGWGLEVRCPHKTCICAIDPLDVMRSIDDQETLTLYKENLLR
eukprot:TRINITY_DN1594_c0_g1_i1.p1 TRINITY_DN1594_c0_g1~~TRINITY_DN1594_c0_g1_i1.p1  ORF type:complete len:399 (-),score=83.01 TRINITY_DN1594_c0_g1_i1:47-1243(-)